MRQWEINVFRSVNRKDINGRIKFSILEIDGNVLFQLSLFATVQAFLQIFQINRVRAEADSNKDGGISYAHINI